MLSNMNTCCSSAVISVKCLENAVTLKLCERSRSDTQCIAQRKSLVWDEFENASNIYTYM